MMVKSITAAAALAVASFASGADAATIDFTGGSGNASSYSYESGLLTVSAFLPSNDVSKRSAGIGVYTGGRDSSQLDNLETLVFSFSEKVMLKSFTLAKFDTRPLFGDNYLVTVRLGPVDYEFDWSNNNPFVFNGTTGVSSDLFSVTAGLLDYFVISSLTYDLIDQTPPDSDPGTPAVPLPAAGFLLVGALGGMAALRRKRS